MLQMCEPLFSTVKSVVMVNGFFVANYIVAVVEREVYAVDLIKKRWYWPKSFPGGPTNRVFLDKTVTNAEMLESVIEESKLFSIFIFK